MIFVSIIAILILIPANVVSADYVDEIYVKSVLTSTPTSISIPSEDTIRVYRSATGKIDVLNDVYDDSRDQNYKPWLVLTDNLKNSVSQTNGIVIKWGDVIICSFYVSGSGDFARYVTYNEGKSGEDIKQSTIGWVTNPPSLNPYNRGAKGQIQANALANKGYTWRNILKYFYGYDIIFIIK